MWHRGTETSLVPWMFEVFYDNSLGETSKSAFWVDCCVCPETLHDPDLQEFLKIYSLSRLRTMSSDWVVIIITPAASPSAVNHTSVSWRSSLEKANKTTSLAQCRDEIMRPVDQTILQLWSGVRYTTRWLSWCICSCRYPILPKEPQWIPRRTWPNAFSEFSKHCLLSQTPMQSQISVRGGWKRHCTF